MKFVEIWEQHLINADEIAYLSAEHNGRYYESYVHLKNGSKFNFLDLVDSWQVENEEIRICYDEIKILHIAAMNYISTHSGPYCISYEELDKNVCDKFEKMYKEKRRQNER